MKVMIDFIWVPSKTHSSILSSHYDCYAFTFKKESQFPPSPEIGHKR